MSKINSYTVFSSEHGVTTVVEVAEYFQNGDIVTVEEHHFCRNNIEFGWARVQSDDQHRRVIGDKELLERFQLIA